MPTWNPWHGCKKISPGCLKCYVYRRDAEFGKDSSIISKTASFHLPVKRSRSGAYKLQPGGECVYTCMTSDFFLEEADEWRPAIWDMIRERSDLQFVIITKRIHRFRVGLPEDWGDGYNHITICCTCENQKMADAGCRFSWNCPSGIVLLSMSLCWRQWISASTWLAVR